MDKMMSGEDQHDDIENLENSDQQIAQSSLVQPNNIQPSATLEDA